MIREDEYLALTKVKRFWTNKPQPQSLGITGIFDNHFQIVQQMPLFLNDELPAIRPGQAKATRLINISIRPETCQDRPRMQALRQAGSVSRFVRNTLRAAYAKVVLEGNPSDFVEGEIPDIGQSLWCWTPVADPFMAVFKRGAQATHTATHFFEWERIAIACAALSQGTSFEEALCPPGPTEALCNEEMCPRISPSVRKRARYSPAGFRCD